MSERIKITVREGNGGSSYELLHDKENTLLETMREGTVMLPSLCGGVGKCGKCEVRFVSHAPLPTQTDRSFLPPEKLREGYRLACMARPKRECVIITDFAEEKRVEEGRYHVVTEYRAEMRMFPGEGIDERVPLEGTDGDFPGGGTERKHPREGTDGDFPGEGTERKHPREGTDGDFLGGGTERKHPKEGTDGDFPGGGTDGKHPREGTDGDFPGGGTDGKHPREGTDGDFLGEGTDGKHPKEETERKHPKEGTERKYLKEGTDRKYPGEGTDEGISGGGADREFPKKGTVRKFPGEGTDREQQGREVCEGGRRYAIDGSIDSGETLIAADIGTTTVAMQLLEIGTGCLIDTYTCLNPQRSFGADVISRIKAAEGDGGKKLQTMVWETLAAGRERLERSTAGQGDRKPKLMVIACNTTMGHILLGHATETLGKSPFQPVDINTAFLQWKGMDVAVMPGISAFVGGDILAGLFACGLCGLMPGHSDSMGLKGLRPAYEPCRPGSVGQREENTGSEAPAWLFIDLGTNAEMVMGTGSRVAATAAAAGPAFEGRGKDGSLGAERISALADLLEKGIADGTGLLAEPYFETGIETEIGEGKRSVLIRQEDIRDIQMAKAAVRAGIHFLMKRLGIKDGHRIEKIYIAGGMGFYLDKQAAVRVGLLPAGLGGNPEAVGNTALAGAGLFGRKGIWKEAAPQSGTDCLESGEMGKRNQEAVRQLEAFAKRVEVFNMAELEEFEEVYIGYMDFDCNEV